LLSIGFVQIGLTVEMTDDSGLHWGPVTGLDTAPSKQAYFEVLSFARLDSNRAAIALHQNEGENYFYVTQDAGKTWKTIHLDNTFAGTLFSRNSEYWAFGIEYLERQKGGGYSAPVVLHSSDGINWSHGTSSPSESLRVHHRAASSTTELLQICTEKSRRTWPCQRMKLFNHLGLLRRVTSVSQQSN
jgi:hypothetical protein